MSEKKTIKQKLEDMDKLYEKECEHPIYKAIRLSVRPFLFGDNLEGDNWVCVTCDKPTKECKCEKKE